MAAAPPLFRPHRRLLEAPELRTELDTGNQYSDDLFYSRVGDVAGFNSIMVIVLAGLLCALMCVLGLNSIIRCATRCGYLLALFEASSPDDHDHHVRATTGLEVVHTAGLKKSTLSQIPVVAYGSSSSTSGLDITATDCPICLGEFEEGVKVRILPECNHGFHVQCIDTWFVSHTSCPLCRQPCNRDRSSP